jgi:hypothetical protein
LLFYLFVGSEVRRQERKHNTNNNDILSRNESKTELEKYMIVNEHKHVSLFSSYSRISQTQSKNNEKENKSKEGKYIDYVHS